MNADIPGQALLDYQRTGKNAQIIIHSPDFEEDHIDIDYYFRSYNDMPEIEQKALKLCSGKVLDIGAGAGSHALWLQDNNIDVTALDISPGACGVMKERGVKNVVNEDFSGFLNHKFDTILMLMNGIGITSGLKGLRSFLLKLPDYLSPGGKLIFDSTNLIYLHTDENGIVSIDLNANYYGEIKFQMEYKNIKGPEFKWLYIDQDLMQAYCDELGYKFNVILEAENFHYLARVSC